MELTSLGMGDYFFGRFGTYQDKSTISFLILNEGPVKVVRVENKIIDVMRTLKSFLKLTGSQCKDCCTGVIWSLFLNPVKSLAGAFFFAVYE